MSEVTADQAAGAQDAAGDSPPKKKDAALTSYLILTKEAGFWTEQDSILARSAKAAITAYAKSKTLPEGVLVAVPARSWQPVTVKTEQTTKLVLT